MSGTYDNGNLTGSGVTVYVIDTGIKTSHNEFGGRAYVGADFIGDGQNGQDPFGHGTHVAGTIGGATYGVAKGVSLCAVRVLDSTGQGTTAQVISGIDWVTANHSGSCVANMSLGGSASTAEDQAVQSSVSSGVTYVVAAGNDATDASGTSPARVAVAITVSASNSSDQRASFANYGSVVDIFAPGVGVVSAGITSNSATATLDGTSMASPHVAGLAAIYLQARPGSSPSDVTSAVVWAASTDKLSSIGSGSPNRLAYFGETWALTGPIYKIVNVNSGHVWDVIGDSMYPGTRIDQWGYVGIASQQWRLVSVGGGAYKIYNVNSGLALEIEGDSTSAGAKADQWQYVGTASQHWYLNSAGSGQYYITNANSGLTLEVENDSTSTGAYIQQWPYANVASQKWTLVQVN